MKESCRRLKSVLLVVCTSTYEKVLSCNYNAFISRQLFSYCQTKMKYPAFQHSVIEKLHDCKYVACVLWLSKVLNKWLFASGGVLEFWCVWNQTIIYVCDEVLTQWQLWCVIKWVDVQNVQSVWVMKTWKSKCVTCFITCLQFQFYV